MSSAVQGGGGQAPLPSMLRQIISSAFGLDLPLEGGSGQAPDDAIVLACSDPNEASRVEMDVIGSLYAMLGLYWTTLGKEIVDGPAGRLERVVCEVKYVAGEQVMTERRSLYFDVSRSVGSGGTTPVCMLYLGDRVRLSLPFEIGWLHYASMTDHEAACPGSGVACRYEAPGMVASVVAYDRREEGIDYRKRPERYHEEFLRSIAEARPVGDDVREVWNVEQPNMRCKAFASGDLSLSVLLLSTLCGKFLKLELALEVAAEEHHLQCIRQSVSFFSAMVGAKPMN